MFWILQGLTRCFGVIVHQVFSPLLCRHFITKRDQQVLLVETLLLFDFTEA